jgi:hypothetical protein
MSTLSISSPRISHSTEVDARFDALVRTAVPAQREGHGAGFETVFDLDYGQSAFVPEQAASAPQDTHRVRISAVEPRPAAPVAVRLTRRGRVVAVLIFLGVALALMTAFGGWATATLSGGTPEPVRVIEVGPGDTLYDIAADVAEPGQIRAMVHRIQELNSLTGSQIQEGAKLAVPRG